MGDLLGLLGGAIWFILPAYVANAAPVIFGGGTPIDMGKRFIDGRPIFGAGKTVRGFLAGLVAGSLVGLMQGVATGSPSTLFALGFLLALGALLGDLAGSFIKRRLGVERGRAMPGLDQLTFVAGALLLASPVSLPSWEVVVALVVITPPIHLATNFAGYKLGLKNRPY